MLKQPRGDKSQIAKYKQAHYFCECGCGHVANSLHHICPAQAKLKIEHPLNYLHLLQYCHDEIELLPRAQMIFRGYEIKQMTLDKGE